MGLYRPSFRFVWASRACFLPRNTGDFVILNNKDNKITKIISPKKGTEIVVVKGKHIGSTGKIKDVHEEGENDIAEIAISGEEDIKVDIKNLFLVGE